MIGQPAASFSGTNASAGASVLCVPTERLLPPSLLRARHTRTHACDKFERLARLGDPGTVARPDIPRSVGRGGRGVDRHRRLDCGNWCWRTRQCAEGGGAKLRRCAQRSSAHGLGVGVGHAWRGIACAQLHAAVLPSATWQRVHTAAGDLEFTPCVGRSSLFCRSWQASACSVAGVRASHLRRRQPPA